jgi:soluble lytic murein transglycosylase
VGTRAPSARCSLVRGVLSRAPRFAPGGPDIRDPKKATARSRAALAWAGLVFLLAAPRAHGASGGGFWLEAAPADAAETQLKAALGAAVKANPVPALEALGAVSANHPGTAGSGLAQLAAGFALLDADRDAEAAPFLLHPDIQKTALKDRAQFGLARAHEAAKKDEAAGQAFLRAAEMDPQGPLFCPALFRGADALSRGGRTAPAVDALNRALTGCPGQQPKALLRLGQILETGDKKAAAAAFDRLEREYPGSVEADEAVKRLRVLAGFRPSMTPQELASRTFRRAVAVAEAGRNADAIPLLRALPLKTLPPADADLVRVRLGTALLARGKTKDAQVQLQAVSAASPAAAEAAYQLAKTQVQKKRPSAYEAVVRSFPGTPWAEEALATLALYYQREGRDEPALPYYERLAKEHPNGRYGDRAIWWVAWADYRRGRYEEAAAALEQAARRRALTSFTPAYLYWAGRAQARMGHNDRAAALFEETVQRFKNQYHGLLAEKALAALPGARRSAAPPAVMIAVPGDPRKEIPEKPLARIRQLLLIDRYEEALTELQALPPSPLVQGTIAWVESKRGRLRPAIVAMKRAYPYWAGAAGDRLPDTVWRIMYPLDFGDLLQASASERDLDPALVAAVVLQESTFDAAAVSSAGARGLMQVMLRTGRAVSRNLGGKKKLPQTALHDAETSLKLGTSYLRQLLNRFGGRVERALAAYNAGPARVATWTSARADMPAEEFVDSIPFVETRGYVMIILAAREHYRRLYSFAPRPQTASTPEGPRAEAP